MAVIGAVSALRSGSSAAAAVIWQAGVQQSILE